MEKSRGFGLLEEQFVAACRESSVEIEKLDELLKQGVNINAVEQDHEEHNLLTEVIKYSLSEGRMKAITEYFIQKGFDTQTLGEACLRALVYSTYDEEILDCAKLILKNGVESKNHFEDVFERIGTEESYQRCCEQHHHLENLFYAFYEIVSKYQANEDFLGVDFYQKCVGKKLEAVFVCGDHREHKEVFSRAEEKEYVYHEYLLFQCEDQPLVITDSPNIYLDATKKQYARKHPQTDELFAPYLGSKIIEIDFDHNEVEKENTTYGQSIIFLKFENGKILKFSNTFGETEPVLHYMEMDG